LSGEKVPIPRSSCLMLCPLLLLLPFTLQLAHLRRWSRRTSLPCKIS
jgi:hypothetical protein